MDSLARTALLPRFEPRDDPDGSGAPCEPGESEQEEGWILGPQSDDQCEHPDQHRADNQNLVKRLQLHVPPHVLLHTTGFGASAVTVSFTVSLFSGRQRELVVKAVVIAAGEGTRLRPLTEDKQTGMVEVAGRPNLTHCFENLVALGADELVVVVGYKKERIVSHYNDEFEGVHISYTHQREPEGIAHALLTAEEHVDDEFMMMLGDNISNANLKNTVNRQAEQRAETAFLVEEVPWEETSRYGVCDTNRYGEIVEVIEKPDDPPSNLVMTGVHTFTPAIFHACYLVQRSNRDEYEMRDAIDLLIHSGRIDAIRMDGWRIDVGYPEDRDEAERRIEAATAESE